MKYLKQDIGKYLAICLIWTFFFNLVFTSFDALKVIFIDKFSFDHVAKGFHLSSFQIFLYIVHLFIFNFISLVLPVALFMVLYEKFGSKNTKYKMEVLSHLHNIMERKSGKYLCIIFPILIACFSICIFFINTSIIESSKNDTKKVNQEPVTRKKNLPNIFYIVIDTLRADHLGSYGYEKNTSPNMDKIAKDGVLFNNCITQSSHTIPSTGSYFTSLYPTMTGVYKSGDVLDNSFITISEVLQKNGWRTTAFSANPNITKHLNFNQGFEYFYDKSVTDNTTNFLLRNSFIGRTVTFFGIITPEFSNAVDSIKKRAEYINTKVFEWLDRTEEKTSVFLYVHYLDPHTPYSPPKRYIKSDYSNKFQDEDVPLYDGEISYIDEQLMLLIEKLKKLKMLDNSLFLITSDHGEEFSHEHGIKGHGYTFYEPLVRVPLIIMKTKYMQITKKIDTQVMALDIYPTILDILGIKINHKIEGVSFKDMLFTDEVKKSSSIAYMEKSKPVYSKLDGKEVCFINGLRIDNKWKILNCEERNTKKRKIALFDLEADQKEIENIADKDEKVKTVFEQKLNAITKYIDSKTFNAKKKKIAPKLIKELKALGYIQ